MSMSLNTRQNVIASIRRQTAVNAKSKKSAQVMLLRLGITNKKGHVAKKYALDPREEGMLGVVTR